MSEQKHKFIGILRVEMEDLSFDIEQLLQKLEKDAKDERIGNYVFQENNVVLNNEIKGVKIAQEMLEKFDPEPFADLDSLISSVRQDIEILFKKQAVFGAAGNIIHRKIDKVRKYVTEHLPSA